MCQCVLQCSFPLTLMHSSGEARVIGHERWNGTRFRRVGRLVGWLVIRAVSRKLVGTRKTSIFSPGNYACYAILHMLYYMEWRRANLPSSSLTETELLKFPFCLEVWHLDSTTFLLAFFFTFFGLCSCIVVVTPKGCWLCVGTNYFILDNCTGDTSFSVVIKSIFVGF